jgi:hypothetical protein
VALCSTTVQIREPDNSIAVERINLSLEHILIIWVIKSDCPKKRRNKNKNFKIEFTQADEDHLHEI